MYNRLCVEHIKININIYRERNRAEEEDNFSVGSVKMTEIPSKSEEPVRSIKTTRTSRWLRSSK